MNGLLGSDGFFDPKIWVKFLTSEKRGNSENINRVFKCNKSFDYKTCLFRILPNLSFIYHKEKEKTEERINLLKQKLNVLDSGNDDCVGQELKQIIK